MLAQKHPSEFLATGVMLASDLALGGGSVGPGSFLGATLEVTTGGTVSYEYIFISDNGVDGVTPEALNPELVDVSAFPVIRPETGTNSIQTVLLTLPAGKVAYSLDFRQYGGITASSIEETIPSSYYAYSEEAVLDLLESGGTKHVYVSGARNPESWWPQLAGIPFSTPNGGQKCGALITPQHLLGVTHYDNAIGSTITFKTAESANVTKTIVGRVNGNGQFQDMMVYLLDSPLPETIEPLTVVGPWLGNVIPGATTHQYAFQHVGILIDQNRECGFVNVGYHAYESLGNPVGEFSDQVPSLLHFAWATYPYKLASLESYRAIYKTFGVPGDSGSAVLVPVTGGWALACLMTGAFSGVFPQEGVLNSLIATVDAAAGISTGYTVTVALDPTA